MQVTTYPLCPDALLVHRGSVRPLHLLLCFLTSGSCCPSSSLHRSLVAIGINIQQRACGVVTCSQSSAAFLRLRGKAQVLPLVCSPQVSAVIAVLGSCSLPFLPSPPCANCSGTRATALLLGKIKPQAPLSPSPLGGTLVPGNPFD